MIDQPVKEKNKWIAAVFAVLLGQWGAHKFYLGHWKLGVLYIAVTATIFAILVASGGSDIAMIGLFGPWAVILVVEGVLFAVKSQEDFHRIYVEGRRAMF